MDGSLAETFNMAVIDSGCTQTVCGKSWLNVYYQSLSKEERDNVLLEDSERTFKFGDGVIVQSKGKVKIPIFLKGAVGVKLETDVVDKEIPLLLSRNSLRRANSVIQFNGNGEDKVVMFNTEQPTSVNESGHLCIPLSLNRYELMTNDKTSNVKPHTVLFTGKLSVLSDSEKVSIAKKLHKQFAHPAGKRLVKLLNDAGVEDKILSGAILKLDQDCEICVKYRKASLKPAVCFPRASDFNQNVALDLKCFAPYYMLHMIDHFTRYSRGIVIKNKHPQTIVNGVLNSWVALFGTPQRMLSDNGGEFNNGEVIEMCEKMNIKVECTAAESPWSNGVNERHNGLLGTMIEKLLEEGTSLENAVCWAISAKNALVNVSGYSPNQLVFGRNPNIPNILNSELPALEPCRYQDKLQETIKGMNDARKAFIHSEADERLKRAVKKKTRTQISSEPFELQSKVYFRRGNVWRGPGTVIGIDNKTVIVKQGGQIYRVPPCECKHINLNAPQAEEVPGSLSSIQISAENNTSVINSGIPLEEEVSDENQEYSNTDEEVTTEISELLNQNQQENEVEVINPHETPLQEPLMEIETQSMLDSGVSGDHSSEIAPPIKSLVKYKLKDTNDWNVVRIVKRGGKVGGKYKNWYNVYDRDSECGEMYSLDWKSVDKWNVVPEEVLMSTTCFKDPDVLEAKWKELESWKNFEVFEEVKNEGQKFITVQWVVTQKFHDDGRSVKARLVARGFQEPNEHIKKDSPTTTRESVRVLLCMAISNPGWTINSLDIKSAFLQGDLIRRVVLLKPPKEANTNNLWRLNKCVYGLTDASRKWYLRVHTVFKKLNMVSVVLDEAVYIWRPKDDVEGIICIHVDDFIWTGTERFKAEVIVKVCEEFCISKQDNGTFRYLGLQIEQFMTCIKVDQKHYVECIEGLEINCNGRKRDEPLDNEEKLLLKAFVGKLAWAANLTHPEIAFETCEASVGNKFATVSDVLKVNKTLRKLKNSDICIQFVPLRNNMMKCKLIVYCDASYANLKGDASQSGYIIFLVDETGNANVLKWKSGKISRVVKSTLAAETLALLDAAETGYYLKRLIESFLGMKEDCIEVRCFTDNKSIVEHVFKSTNKVSDFRLRVDIACLRDMIQRQEISHIHWIGTTSQVADCLTKANCSSKNLSEILSSNLLNSNILAKCRIPKFKTNTSD